MSSLLYRVFGEICVCELLHVFVAKNERTIFVQHPDAGEEGKVEASIAEHYPGDVVVCSTIANVLHYQCS